MPVPRIAFGQKQFEEELAQLQALNQKHIEPLEIDHTEFGTIKVFNIHEQPHTVDQGGIGTKYIPACPKDKVYSRPLELWKQYPEGRATEHANKMRMAVLDGWNVAESLIGYGAGYAPNYGLLKMGVFACNAFATMMWEEEGVESSEVIARSRFNLFRKARRGAVEVTTRECTATAIKAAKKSIDHKGPNKWPDWALELKTEDDFKKAILAGDLPTEKEIDEANDRLTKHAQEMVTLASSFWAAGNKLEATQPPYLWAARRTNNQGLEWAKGVVMMSECHFCRTAIHPDALICLACKNIAPGKEQEIIERRAAGFEFLWDPSHPAYKKSK